MLKRSATGSLAVAATLAGLGILMAIAASNMIPQLQFIQPLFVDMAQSSKPFNLFAWIMTGVGSCLFFGGMARLDNVI